MILEVHLAIKLKVNKVLLNEESMIPWVWIGNVIYDRYMHSNTYIVWSIKANETNYNKFYYLCLNSKLKEITY